jgi:replicative DNA helicase
MSQSTKSSSSNVRDFEAGQHIPHAHDAEVGLINLVIRDAQCLYRVQEAGIQPEHFFSELAGSLFELLVKLTDQGKGTHPGKFNIVQALKRDYTTEYLDFYYSTSQEAIAKDWLDRYIRQITNAYKKRELIRLAAELTTMAYAPDIAADAGIAFALNEAERVDRATNPLNIMNGASYENYLRDYYKKAPDLPKGAPSGINPLDGYTGGTRLGEFTLLYAKPGYGKSSLFLQACFHRALVLKRPQLWLTIGDMTAEQDWFRFIQQQTGLDALDQAQGSFRDSQGRNRWNDIDGYLKQLGGSKLFIHQAGKIHTLEAGRIIKKLLREVETLDVYIDHIGHFSDQAENIYQKTVMISNALVGFAHEIVGPDGNHRVSINAISPINKAGETVGAQDLQHAAETVMKIEPLPVNEGGPDKTKAPDEQSGWVKVAIEKNRWGGSGAVKLFFNAPQAKFLETDYSGRDS